LILIVVFSVFADILERRERVMASSSRRMLVGSPRADQQATTSHRGSPVAADEAYYTLLGGGPDISVGPTVPESSVHRIVVNNVSRAVNVAAPLPFWKLFEDHFATDVSFEDMLLLVDRSTMATSIIRAGRMNENRWCVVALGEVRLLLQPM
jgi:hypothetical protein